MLQGRDADGGHSQQYFSVRDRWFWNIHEFQPFITAELFRPHCTHIGLLCHGGEITHAFLRAPQSAAAVPGCGRPCLRKRPGSARRRCRSEEHTSELQSQFHLVCRLLLEKKKKY